MIRGWKRVVLLFSSLLLVLPSAGLFLSQPQPVQAAGPKKIFDIVDDPAPTEPGEVCGAANVYLDSYNLDNGKAADTADIQAFKDDPSCVQEALNTLYEPMSEAWTSLVVDIQLLRAPPPDQVDASKAPLNKLYKLDGSGQVIFSSDIQSPSLGWALVFPPIAIINAFVAVKNAYQRWQDGGRGTDIWADFVSNRTTFVKDFAQIYKIENLAKAAGITWNDGDNDNSYAGIPNIARTDVLPLIKVEPKSDFETKGFQVIDCSDPSECTEVAALQGIAKKYAHFAPGGDYVKDLEVIAARSQAAATGNDRCGSDPGYHISRIFPYVFCTVTLFVMDVGEFLLDMSSSLLLVTSGIPGNDDGQSNVFQGLSKDTFLGPVQDKLVDTSFGQLARTAYNYILGLCNTAILLLLIVIALANILQVQVNTYSLKKLLPGLIIGLILANMSFFIIRAGLELSGQLSQGLMDQLKKNCDPGTGSTTTSGSSGSGTTSGTAGSGTASTACGFSAFKFAFRQMGSVKQDPSAHLTKVEDKDEQPDTALVFQQFILNFFLYAAAIMVFILAFLFMIRTFIFIFAAAIAPFAFLGLYFPPLGFIWKRWAALVTSWIFMPVVAFFWLWLGFLWFKSPPPTSGFLTYVLGYVFGIVSIYLAMKTPFTLAGEAKQMVNKWNDLGSAVGKRYTPYGAGSRAYNRIKNNYAKNDELLNKGAIIQNELAKKAGGNWINQKMSAAEAKVAQKEAMQKAEEEEALAKALEQLAKGKPAFIDAWKESNIGFVKKLGEVLDKGVTMKNAVTNATGMGISYAQRDARIRDAQGLAAVAKSASNKSLTKSYYDGEMGVNRAKRDRQAEANDKAADKAKNDANLTASHRYIAEHVKEADPLLDHMKGATDSAGNLLVADGDLPTDVNGLMNFDVGSISDATPEGKALRDQVSKFQGKYKDLYKASSKHITTTQKTDMKDNIEKDPSELSFNKKEQGDFIKLMKGLDHTFDPAKGTIDGMKPNDISDLTSRAGALMKIATTANDLSKVKEAVKAVEALQEPIQAAITDGTAPPEAAAWMRQLTDMKTAMSGATDKKQVAEAIKKFKAFEGGFYDLVTKRPPNPYKSYKGKPGRGTPPAPGGATTPAGGAAPTPTAPNPNLPPSAGGVPNPPSTPPPPPASGNTP